MNWTEFTQAVAEYPVLTPGVPRHLPDGSMHPVLQAWHEKWDRLMIEELHPALLNEWDHVIEKEQ